MHDPSSSYSVVKASPSRESVEEAIEVTDGLDLVMVEDDLEALDAEVAEAIEEEIPGVFEVELKALEVEEAIALEEEELEALDAE